MIQEGKELSKDWLNEVKAEENLKAKSLKVFVEKYNPKTAIRTSMNAFRQEEWLVNVPLYAIGSIVD